MDINIKTKYNIGDIVYIPEHYEEFFPSKPLTIISISVKVLPDVIYTEYEVCGGEFEYCEKASEDCIFLTYEECTKWCDNHNKNS